MYTLTELYQYFDDLLAQDDDELLFVSSYLRGFISLSAVPFGDEQQKLSSALVAAVSERLQAAKTELAPNDRQLVQTYWQQLQANFNY
jgi:hypothetical protein